MAPLARRALLTTTTMIPTYLRNRRPRGPRVGLLLIGLPYHFPGANRVALGSPSGWASRAALGGHRCADGSRRGRLRSAETGAGVVLRIRGASEPRRSDRRW